MALKHVENKRWSETPESQECGEGHYEGILFKLLRPMLKLEDRGRTYTEGSKEGKRQSAASLIE